MIRGRRRRGRRSQAGGTPRLKITSMMDILTVLLLFLLKSFVVDGEVVTPPPGIELPESVADEAPEASLVVAVSGEAILVGGVRVATVAEALSGNDLVIAPLAQCLEEERSRMSEIAALQGLEDAPAARVTIQGDRNLEYQLLQRVMATCSAGGFDELALAVIRES